MNCCPTVLNEKKTKWKTTFITLHLYAQLPDETFRNFLEPKNPEIAEFYAARKRWSAAIKGSKKRNVRSGKKCDSFVLAEQVESDRPRQKKKKMPHRKFHAVLES